MSLYVGTLKIAQTYFTQCLDVFANYPAFSEGPCRLRVQVLKFVNRQVSDNVCLHHILIYLYYA